MKRKVSEQVKANAKKNVPKQKKFEGDTATMISTGSTELDLAISGGRVRGGGLPGGILVEISGPKSSGKTVLLCEIAGAIQRQGGQVKFRDPEARLNKNFVRLFDMNPDIIEYDTPDTVTEVFTPIRTWEPEPIDVIHGVFNDSLAALSTDLEMEEGVDKMGMRRAKEFSEECRKTCRIITKRNFLVVCSNQLRQNSGGGTYGPKYTSPGGEAIGFYSSLQLRTKSVTKLKTKKKFKGKEVVRITAIETDIEVIKSSVWESYRTARVIIDPKYGIDDVRANLQFLKRTLGTSTYELDGQSLGKGIIAAIGEIEDNDLEETLRNAVIDVWEEVESMYSSKRKKKRRF